MRYFITLSYDGTAYHGWQVQPHSSSVQEVLQNALSTLSGRQVEIVGAGRTDTGVHASMMVAHFDSETDIDCPQLVYKLNKFLPRDIAVHKVEPVCADIHARFSAKSRTYHYFVHTSKCPFCRHYSWQVWGQLDFESMNKAAKVIMEYSDFTSFSKSNTDTKTNICTITEAEWRPCPSAGIASDEGSSYHEEWVFVITANRFLRNMVRAIVGTLIEVGRGKLSVDDIRKIIEAKDRCKAGESVPANALFLVDIKY